MHTPHFRFLALGSLLALLLVAAGCQQESLLPQEPGEGRIVLTMADAEPFTDVETRAVQDVSDLTGYLFTLSGTTAEGVAVATTITFDANSSAVIEAGTYTLTAENMSVAASEVGLGQPYYRGTSTSFTLEAGGTQPVSIALGKPKNAKVTLAFDASFTSKYTNARVTLTSGSRSVTLTAATPSAYFTVPTGGTLPYSVTADALPDSHVTDITATTGTLTVAAGNSSTFTLAANPLTGELIPVLGGEHTGEFD